MSDSGSTYDLGDERGQWATDDLWGIADAAADDPADDAATGVHVDVYRAAADDAYAASVDAYLAGDDVAAYELNQAYLSSGDVDSPWSVHHADATWSDTDHDGW